MQLMNYTPHPHLADCPFCGGKLGEFFKHLVTASPVLDEVPTRKGWQVRCGSCEATSGVWTSRTEAITAWNRRAKTAAELTNAELIGRYESDRQQLRTSLQTITDLQHRISALTREIGFEVSRIAR